MPDPFDSAPFDKLRVNRAGPSISLRAGKSGMTGGDGGHIFVDIS